MTFELGITVDQSDPINEALTCPAPIVQLQIGDPQSWKAPSLGYQGGPQALREAAEAAGVGIYVHAPYVINVASTNNRIRIPGRKLLQQHVSMAAEIGARGVIVHGGHVTANDDPAKGYENWFKAIDGLRLDCPVLIENTAGGAHAMARYLDSIAKLWEAISAASDFDQVGFCLDSCHAHASGEDLDGIVDRVLAITGRIDLVHLNDSRDAAGSGADRHAHLGQGQIDPELLVEIVRQANAPTILETHGSVQDQCADMAWLNQRL
ncbi:deoxyribonuclease IV [Brooklawnia sp.]|uniref:deoxyribonuclease IV n=1 Tax=Brooklawnia sp. TaxID=2699740 RepID=UPI00311D3C88